MHILGAIVAFGPTFSHRFIGAMGGAEPQHRSSPSGELEARGTNRAARPRPGVTGVGLLFTSGIDLGAARWLQVAIVRTFSPSPMPSASRPPP
jgi:hypothetical protein